MKQNRTSRIHDQVVGDELKNNPRYENNIYVYMMTEPIRPRLYHSDELRTFSDGELYRYFKGDKQ
jgi:hypothetical protein